MMHSRDVESDWNQTQSIEMEVEFMASDLDGAKIVGEA